MRKPEGLGGVMRKHQLKRAARFFTPIRSPSPSRETTAWMQEVEQCREQLPEVRMRVSSPKKLA